MNITDFEQKTICHMKQALNIVSNEIKSQTILFRIIFSLVSTINVVA